MLQFSTDENRSWIGTGRQFSYSLLFDDVVLFNNDNLKSSIVVDWLKLLGNGCAQFLCEFFQTKISLALTNNQISLCSKKL